MYSALLLELAVVGIYLGSVVPVSSREGLSRVFTNFRAVLHVNYSLRILLDLATLLIMLHICDTSYYIIIFADMHDHTPVYSYS